MRIWNSDGGEVESCGNAARCVVQLTGARRIDSDGGPIEGENFDTEVEVSIGEPRFGWDEIPLAYAMDTAALPMAWDELARPMALNVGNPHLVFFVDELESVPLDVLGPKIEHDPGLSRADQCQRGRDRRRRHPPEDVERGAGLTLACGTGACATAVAAIRTKRTKSPVKVTCPGGR